MPEIRFLKRPPIEALALRGYRRERLSELSLPVASGLMEGGFVGVIADKIFGVPPMVLALISAAPMFGNLASFFWARIAHGRRKVPVIVALQCAFVLLVASVALVPSGPLGAWWLVCAQIGARLLIGGIITVRSLVWTLNYPRETRSRVTSRLQLLFALTVAITVLVGSLILDRDPSTFRWLYLGGGLLASLGIVAFAGVPLRGEEAQLALERGSVEIGAEGAATPPRTRPSALEVLRSDRTYARYLAWQFLLGVSNMMVEPALIFLVSNRLGASYTTSIGITVGIPFALMVLSVPLWAPYLDRVHISHFRARHSWLFAASQAFLFVGAWQGSLALIALGRVVTGAARGGGTIAWQLGHNDFATPERVGLYMGVHVTLTGLRGLIAPFAGMLLFVGWSPLSLPGIGLDLPGWSGLGAGLMALSCGLSVIASLGFVGLDRRITRERAAR